MKTISDKRSLEPIGFRRYPMLSILLLMILSNTSLIAQSPYLVRTKTINTWSTWSNQFLNSSNTFNITPYYSAAPTAGTLDFFVSSTFTDGSQLSHKVYRPKITLIQGDLITSEFYYDKTPTGEAGEEPYQFNHLGIKYQKETDANYSFGRIDYNFVGDASKSYLNDMFVMKTEVDGDIVWSKRYHFPTLPAPILTKNAWPKTYEQSAQPKYYPTSMEVVTKYEYVVPTPPNGGGLSPDPQLDPPLGTWQNVTYITITGRIEFPNGTPGALAHGSSHGFIMQLNESGNVLWNTFFVYDSPSGVSTHENATNPTKITHIPGVGFHVTGGTTFRDNDVYKSSCTPDNCFPSGYFRNATINLLVSFHGNLIWDKSFESKRNEISYTDCRGVSVTVSNSQNRGSSSYFDPVISAGNPGTLYILGADYQLTPSGDLIKWNMVDKIDISNGNILDERQYPAEQILKSFYPNIDNYFDENFEHNITINPHNTEYLIVSGYHDEWIGNTEIGFYPFSYEIDKHNLTLRPILPYPGAYTVYPDIINPGYRSAAFEQIYTYGDFYTKYHPTMSFLQFRDDEARQYVNGHNFDAIVANNIFDLHFLQTKNTGISKCQDYKPEYSEMFTSSEYIDNLLYAKPYVATAITEDFTKVTLETIKSDICQPTNSPGGGNMPLFSNGQAIQDGDDFKLISNAKVSITPNPTSDYLNFNNLNFHDVSNIIINDVTGRSFSFDLSKVTSNNFQVDLRNLKADLYFVSFYHKDSKERIRMKFVKE